MAAPTPINYTTLISMVQTYFQRSDLDFINNLPNFINLTENKLALSVKNLGQEQFTLTTGYTQIVNKPTGWRQTVSVKCLNTVTNTVKYLASRQLEFCQYYDGDTYPNTTDDLPLYYADYDFYNWYLSSVDGNVSPSNMQLTFAFYSYPPLLSPTIENNWWTTYCPQALFYGVMAEASIYTRDDERAQGFLQLFQTELTNINTEDKNRFSDQTYARKTALQGDN